jgi:hypothetical protein
MSWFKNEMLAKGSDVDFWFPAGGIILGGGRKFERWALAEGSKPVKT